MYSFILVSYLYLIASTVIAMSSPCDLRSDLYASWFNFDSNWSMSFAATTLSVKYSLNCDSKLDSYGKWVDDMVTSFCAFWTLSYMSVGINSSICAPLESVPLLCWMTINKSMTLWKSSFKFSIFASISCTTYSDCFNSSFNFLYSSSFTSDLHIMSTEFVLFKLLEISLEVLLVLLQVTESLVVRFDLFEHFEYDLSQTVILIDVGVGLLLFLLFCIFDFPLHGHYVLL